MIGKERTLPGHIVPILEARQKASHSRDFPVDRLRDLAQRLPQSGAGAVGIVEDLATRRRLPVVVEVVDHPSPVTPPVHPGTDGGDWGGDSGYHRREGTARHESWENRHGSR